MVLEDPFVWPPLERRREFAAANLKAESYLEREHNARWAALGVAHATHGTTANVLTLLLPRSILARDQLNHLSTRCAGQRGGTMANGYRSP